MLCSWSARRACTQGFGSRPEHMRKRNVDSDSVFTLPFIASHVAVHWEGHHDALVKVAFDAGAGFAAASTVLHDEVGEQKNDGRTYGAVMLAGGASAVRVVTDRSLPRLRVLAMVDGERTVTQETVTGALAAPSMPVVISRAGWGCDESLMTWPPEFYPIQKLICHHTATQNRDPDPAATIRAIYYYHAVTQAWGDIGYNFLIDESGRVYEGRYSRPYAASESPTGEDASGNGVTAAHAQGYNSGTVGIALLGTLTDRDATPAARAALEKLIAWIDSTHGIDPQGASLYTNPVSGTQRTFPNIAGHRDVGATECPGGTFYATLPTVRSDVASLIAPTGPDFSLAASPSSTATIPGGSVSYSVAVGATNGFAGSVSLALAGLPGGASASFAPSTLSAPGSALLTVQTAGTTPPGSYPLTISGASGSTTHSAPATLLVNPPPDFSLSLSPTSRSIKRGA